MNQQIALDHLEKMRQAIQRFRSICRDGLEDENEMAALVYLNKWIWDDRYCPLTSLVKVIDRDHVTGMEMFNFMTVLHRYMPEVQVCMPEHVWPEASMSLITDL
jgi:hypothetical protein